MLLVVFAGISIHAGQMVRCGWCNGSGKGTECRRVVCGTCYGNRVLNSCMGCNGSGCYINFEMVLPCGMCFGSGRMPCNSCWGSGYQIRTVVTPKCKMCNGKKMVLAPPQLTNSSIQMPISMPISMPLSYPTIPSSPSIRQQKTITGKCGCGAIIEPLKLGRYECDNCWVKRTTPRY